MRGVREDPDPGVGGGGGGGGGVPPPPPPPHVFTSRLPSFLAKSSDVLQLSFHNGIFFSIA